MFPVKSFAERGSLIRICVGQQAVAYLLGHAIYDLYFHPLAKYPGPKFAAVSQIPVAVKLWNGDLHLWLRHLHQEYNSDVVRVSPHELSFISPSAWRDIYSTRVGHPGFPKDPVGFGGKNSLLTADNADHSRMRRLLSHAFSEKALREQQALIEIHVENLVKGLHKQASGPSKGQINVVDWCHWTTFDIIGDLAFGEPFDCLANNEYTPWVEKLMQGLKAVAAVSVATRFKLLDRILRWYISRSRMVKDALEHGRLSREKMHRRMQKGAVRPDFVSYIIKHNSEKAGMTQNEIDRNASVFINAGSQTTATFLCGAIWFIVQNPSCVDEIRQELKQVGNLADETTLHNLSQMKYLQAFISECHRMYPGALAGLPRSAAHPGDMAGRHFATGGTGVHLNQFAAYRTAFNFKDPDEFVPARWLGDRRYDSDRKDILQPFAMGPRNCLGKNLANAEILLILSRLVSEFDFDTCEATDSAWLDQKAWFGWDKKPLIVKVRSRRQPTL